MSAPTDFDAIAASLPTVMPLAKKPAHNNLQRKLLEFGVDSAVAEVIARAVVDPTDARRRLDHLVPVRVPGGQLFSLDVLAWTPMISNFPVNNREATARSFPAGGRRDGEADRFRPLRPAEDAPDGSARLVQRAASIDHAIWSLERSVQYLLDNNNLVDSVAAQGVMVPVIAAPITITPDDDSAPVTILGTADGSSRMASAHHVLDLTPREVLVDLPSDERNARGQLSDILAVLQRPAEEVTEDDLRKIRAVQIPVRILLRFEPDEQVDTGFAKAVEALVHLLHVEPAKQWDDAASLDSKADSVITSLYESGQLTPTRRAYADGMLTPDEARSRGLGGEADERAMWLIGLISSNRAPIKQAVRAGVLELTRGKQVRKEAKAQIAVELGLRAVRTSHPASHAKSARLALQSAMQSHLLWGKDLDVMPGESPEQLRDLALAELAAGEPAEACTRIIAKGGFWLAVHRVLREAHFFAAKSDRDGRSPQRVLEALGNDPHGIHVLYRAIVDGRDGQPPVSVDKEGRRRTAATGQPIKMSSEWLRQDVVPAQGKTNQESPTDTQPFPTRQLLQRVTRLKNAIDALDDLHREIRAVTTSGGSVLVDEEGISSGLVKHMQNGLSNLDRRLTLYEAFWTRKNDEDADDDALDGAPPSDETEVA